MYVPKTLQRCIPSPAHDPEIWCFSGLLDMNPNQMYLGVPPKTYQQGGDDEKGNAKELESTSEDTPLIFSVVCCVSARGK